MIMDDLWGMMELSQLFLLNSRVVIICDSVNGLNISCTEIPTVLIYSLNARYAH